MLKGVQNDILSNDSKLIIIRVLKNKKRFPRNFGENLEPWFWPIYLIGETIQIFFCIEKAYPNKDKSALRIRRKQSDKLRPLAPTFPPKNYLWWQNWRTCSHVAIAYYPIFYHFARKLTLGFRLFFEILNNRYVIRKNWQIWFLNLQWKRYFMVFCKCLSEWMSKSVVRSVGMKNHLALGWRRAFGSWLREWRCPGRF